ncbi:MAG: hypothetical protein KIT16_09870 [Rhodospirillaceae bacterium]|nr:hypothetical protein [Rhodospirillaceae bacterium]
MDRLKTSSRPRSRTATADLERRTRAFLRGFAIADEQEARELARRLLRLAPSGDSAALEAVAGAWFARLLGWPEAAAARALAAGRLAWLSTGCATRWAEALFADVPPAGLAQTLRAGVPSFPPTMLDDMMPPASLEAPRLRKLFRRHDRLRPRPA